MRNTIWILAAILLFACTSPQEKLQNRISEAEKLFFQEAIDGNESDDAYLKVIDLYEEYAATFPSDSLSLEYLLRAADVYRGAGEYESALATYDKILADYPDNEKGAVALFLKGFVYENEMFQFLDARQAYTDFVVTYPDHEFADDAQFLLEHMNQSTQSIIHEFKQNASDTSQVE